MVSLLFVAMAVQSGFVDGDALAKGDVACWVAAVVAVDIQAALLFDESPA